MSARSSSRRSFLSASASLLATTSFASTVRAQGAAVPVRVGVIPVVGAAPIFVADGEGWAKEAGLDLAFTTFESGPHDPGAGLGHDRRLRRRRRAARRRALARHRRARSWPPTAIDEMVFVGVPRLAPYFAPGRRAGRGASSATARRRASPRASRRSRRARCPTPRCSTGSGRSPRPTATMSRSCRWASTRRSRRCWPAPSTAHRSASRRSPSSRSANPGIKLIAVGDEMFPGQPGTVVAVSGAFVDKNPAAVQALVDALVRAADLLQARPRPGRAGRRGRSRQGHRRSRHHQGGADVAGHQVRRRSARASSRRRRRCRPIRSRSARCKEAAPLDGLFEPRFYEKARRPG